MRLFITLLFIILASLASSANAQDTYPGKPLRLVVPLPPGGPTDYLARTVAKNLSVALSQPVVVDNKPGADGAIAAREVIAAPADGYTLLFATGSMPATPLLSKPRSFDWQEGLTAVGKVGRISFCLVVHPDVPASTIAEFIAYARAHPDQLNFASSTLGELMVASQFMQATGIRMTRIPYKGGALAMPDLLAGRVQVMFGPVTLVQAHAKNGAVRVLATLLPQRSSALPDIPTLAEAGYHGVSVPTWQSIFVPAKTPRAVVSLLAKELMSVMAKSEVRSELEQRAIFVEPSTPQVLAATVEQEQAAWSKLIAEYKLAPE